MESIHEGGGANLEAFVITIVRFLRVQIYKTDLQRKTREQLA